MTTKFNNYKVITFKQFDVLIEQELDNLYTLDAPNVLDELDQGGVFGIHCFKTNKTLLIKSSCILSSLQGTHDDLISNLFELSDELLQDFQRFGYDNFAFIIIKSGPEFYNIQHLDQVFLSVKESWPYPRYMSEYY